MNKILKIDIGIRDCHDLNYKTFNYYGCGTIYPLKVITNIGEFRTILPFDVVSYVYESTETSYLTIPKVVEILGMLNKNGIKFHLTGNISEHSWQMLERYKEVFHFHETYPSAYVSSKQCTPEEFVYRLAQLKKVYPLTQIQTLDNVDE